MNMKRITALLLAILMLLAASGSGLAAKKAKPSIKLSAKVGFMYEGASVTIKPKLTNVQKADVSFSSSDTDVAAVGWDGRIEAVSPGRSVITVAGGGASAKCGVVVLPRSVSVDVGGTYSLPYGTVEKYAVQNKAVATVSKKGVITGKKAGQTAIKVKYGKQTLTLTVKVAAAASATDDANEAPVQDAQNSKAAKLAAAKSATQIVLVEYSSGSSATLSVHEKQNGVWKQLFETPAYVGKNGIGKTKEGDKKTPKGTYNLNTPFGILADPGANMPYTKVTKYHYWCGASKSGYYNQLCDSRVNGRSYTSSDEHLIDYKGAYNYCMFIDYNAEGKAGKGSCIFLHCFSKNKYTAGCVAVSQASMKKIIQWAQPGVKIVIQ